MKDDEMEAENPKDRLGSTKPSLDAIPPVAILELGQGMNNGREKYGLMNYRHHKTLASVYYNAALRHLLAWWDGEDRASDSGVHHLGHAMACLAIILDAVHLGNFEDDRPNPGPFQRRVDSLTRSSPQDADTPDHRVSRILGAYEDAYNSLEKHGMVPAPAKVREWIRLHDLEPKGPKFYSVPEVLEKVARDGNDAYALTLAWLRSLSHPAPDGD